MISSKIIKNIIVPICVIIFFALLILFSIYFVRKNKENKMIERYTEKYFQYHLIDKNKVFEVGDESKYEEIEVKFANDLRGIESKLDKKNSKLKEKIINHARSRAIQIQALNLDQRSRLNKEDLKSSLEHIERRTKHLFTPKKTIFDGVNLIIEGKIITIVNLEEIRLLDEIDFPKKTDINSPGYSLKSQEAINIYKGLLLLSKTTDYKNNDNFKRFLLIFEEELKKYLGEKKFKEGDSASQAFDFELMTKNDLVYYGLIPFSNEKTRPIYIDEISNDDKNHIEQKLKDLEVIYIYAKNIYTLTFFMLSSSGRERKILTRPLKLDSMLNACQ